MEKPKDLRAIQAVLFITLLFAFEEVAELYYDLPHTFDIFLLCALAALIIAAVLSKLLVRIVNWYSNL